MLVFQGAPGFSMDSWCLLLTVALVVLRYWNLVWEEIAAAVDGPLQLLEVLLMESKTEPAGKLVV
jgi:hypothetical protein